MQTFVSWRTQNLHLLRLSRALAHYVKGVGFTIKCSGCKNLENCGYHNYKTFFDTSICFNFWLFFIKNSKRRVHKKSGFRYLSLTNFYHICFINLERPQGKHLWSCHNTISAKRQFLLNRNENLSRYLHFYSTCWIRTLRQQEMLWRLFPASSYDKA